MAAAQLAAVGGRLLLMVALDARTALHDIAAAMDGDPGLARAVADAFNHLVRNVFILARLHSVRYFLLASGLAGVLVRPAVRAADL